MMKVDLFVFIVAFAAFSFGRKLSVMKHDIASIYIYNPNLICMCVCTYTLLAKAASIYCSEGLYGHITVLLKSQPKPK